MAKNASYCFDLGSKSSPLLGECRNIEQGVALGDFKMTTLNAGVLAMYMLPVSGGVGSMKLGM